MEIEWNCQYCGRGFRQKSNCKRHELTCKANPINVVNTNLVCRHCGKSCKNDNSLRNHERLCKKNPSRKISPFVKWNSTHDAWNKGLTKETDKRVKQSGETLSEGYKSGRLVNSNTGTHHSDEHKKKISEGRKKYLNKHPDKVPYLINHHSKGDSYPEKYFKEVFDNEHIEYKQNYYQCGYFLDFAWPEKKIYLEVDGEQHYLDKRIVEHDKVRTQKLLENGWTCIERVRWSEFKHLSNEKKSEYLKLVFENLE